MSDHHIRTGCIVKHIPSGEEWRLLGVDRGRGKVCVAGWPPTIAELADCEYAGEGWALDEQALTHRQSAFGGGWDE